ncbi:hypothetical protein VNO80_05354 [Phaseolus coccineus]|uniref:Uncharacterized protein n=1 Tax=Phaseolus coccineus TaxID=3886 RepID=A0AAN9RHX5_PHACN
MRVSEEGSPQKRYAAGLTKTKIVNPRIDSFLTQPQIRPYNKDREKRIFGNNAYTPPFHTSNKHIIIHNYFFFSHSIFSPR